MSVAQAKINSVIILFGINVLRSSSEPSATIVSHSCIFTYNPTVAQFGLDIREGLVVSIIDR